MASQTIDPPTHRSHPSRKIRILVGEEDTDFVSLLESSLESSEGLYQIEKTSSGEECLKKLQMGKFDILLLDHSLPDGKGLDWLRRYNQMGIGIPTIFVTLHQTYGVERTQSLDFRSDYDLGVGGRVHDALHSALRRTDGPGGYSVELPVL